jgi:hypothetical protein
MSDNEPLFRKGDLTIQYCKSKEVVGAFAICVAIQYCKSKEVVGACAMLVSPLCVVIQFRQHVTVKVAFYWPLRAFSLIIRLFLPLYYYYYYY